MKLANFLELAALLAASSVAGSDLTSTSAILGDDYGT